MMIKNFEKIKKKKKKPLKWQLIKELLNQHSSIIEYCEQKTQDEDFDPQDVEAAEVCSYTLERTLEGLINQVYGLNNEMMDIKEEEQEEEEEEDEQNKSVFKTNLNITEERINLSERTIRNSIRNPFEKEEY